MHACSVVRSGRVDGMGACDPTHPTPPGPTGRGPTREGGIGTETHITWHCRHIRYPYTYPYRPFALAAPLHESVGVCIPYMTAGPFVRVWFQSPP